ncbi:hypothetical protein Tco_0934885 [Tanacetum coccineum]
MMTLPSEHLLTFNKHKDAKSLFEAIEARFGCNEATKKTQKTLLKQMYETFNATSSESIDSIFTASKIYLGSISFDDFYNNFKIVEQEVKRSVISSSNSGSQNLAFLSGHSHTNIDATIYAYLATQPNGSQVVHEDLEQIHEDDLDEMDLKWKLALLIREQNRSQDSSRRIVNVEESSSKAKLAIDGTGFDWSYMADDEASTNFALMAFSDSEIAIKGLSFSRKQLSLTRKMKVERLKKEKEDNQFKIDNFENASKSLDQLIGNQISDNNKKGLGYNVVPPPLTGLFAPPSIDLSNSGLEKFKQPEFEEMNVRRNFALTAVLTKSDLVPFSTARSFNTAVPSVNVSKLRTNAFQKSHSPLRRPFYQQTALKNRNLNNKVNTVKVIFVNTVKGKRMTSAVGEQGINDVKPTTYWAWRPKIKMINNIYKNTGSCISEFAKNYMVINAPYYCNEALAIPGQTATGYTLGSGEDSLKLIELMDLCTKLINKVTILENALKKSKESHAQTLTMLMKKDWKTSSNSTRYKVCKITRADGSSSFMRYSKHYLWGDLRMIFDPNEEEDQCLNHSIRAADMETT